MKKLSNVTQERSEDTLPVKSKCKLSSMKSMKRLSSNLKLNGQIDEFLELEKTKLNVECADNELYLNTIVLKEVMQSAERFFVYGNKTQRDMLKNEAVLLLMSKYFNDDEDVLNRFIEITFNKVSKYGFVRRLLMRMYNRVFKKRNR